MDQELRQYLIDMEERIVSSLKAYVDQRSEQVETKLLTAFHQWASPLEARQRSHAGVLRALDLEMDVRRARQETRTANPGPAVTS